MYRGQLPELVGSLQVYFGEGDQLRESGCVHDPNPAELGWAVLFAPKPRPDSNALFMASLSARSHWLDSASDRDFENPTSLKIFDRIWRLWKPRLCIGVECRSETGGKPGLARHIYYSRGALEWQVAGGVLRDYMAPMNDFSVPIASSRK